MASSALSRKSGICNQRCRGLGWSFVAFVIGCSTGTRAAPPSTVPRTVQSSTPHVMDPRSAADGSDYRCGERQRWAWVLEYTNGPTNYAVWDERFEPALRSVVPSGQTDLTGTARALIDVILDVLGGPSNLVHGGPGGSTVLSACRQHSCSEKGFLLVDASSGSATAAVATLDSSIGAGDRGATVYVVRLSGCGVTEDSVLCGALHGWARENGFVVQMVMVWDMQASSFRARRSGELVTCSIVGGR